MIRMRLRERTICLKVLGEKDITRFKKEGAKDLAT